MFGNTTAMNCLSLTEKHYAKHDKPQRIFLLYKIFYSYKIYKSQENLYITAYIKLTYNSYNTKNE